MGSFLICFALRRKAKICIATPLLRPCVPKLCLALAEHRPTKHRFAFAMRRPACPSLAKPLRRSAVYCFAKPLHLFKRDLLPFESTLSGVSPLSNTSELTIVEPFFYGVLEVRVENLNRKLYGRSGRNSLTVR